MEGFLRADASSTFPGSPSNSFMADEVASTCPLLTPSPPTNALVNSLPISDNSSVFISAHELATKLHHVQDDNAEGNDSASSSSSALAEPACTQLLNNHNHYLHKSKDEHAAAQETGGKTQNLQMTFRNPPENYFFMKWNWPLVRKISAWLFLSCMVAMVAVVVAMIWTLPKVCNPPTQWYQGKVMYEIFSASFSDSNGDGIGDLKGISSRAEYLHSLGISAIRLNSIFPSRDYPENYKNVSSITEIAPQLGNLTDFAGLVSVLHGLDINVTLDLPIWPYVKNLNPKKIEIAAPESNNTEPQPSYEFLRTSDSFGDDEVASALRFWLKSGVDGFYLKGLEFLAQDPNFAQSLRNWKKIVGPDRMLMVNYEVIDATANDVINVVLNNVDLVDVCLNVDGGVEAISNQIEYVLNSTLFVKAGSPWVHWSLSNENTVRLANRLPFSNATLGASLLELMLPGTPSIFYGDEIGLQQISDPKEELQHMHQLAPMAWKYPYKPFTRKGILPWMHSQLSSTNHAQFEIISKMANLRSTSPSIYMNSLKKDGSNKANAEVKYKANDLLVIQRWYPRRKSYVVVSNLGCNHTVADLSTLLYSGEILVGPTADSKSESISFKEVSLWPGESVIVLLH